MKLKLVVLIFVMSLFSCKKNKEARNMSLIGVLQDSFDKSAISGATIKLYYKPYQNGVFLSTFALHSYATTSSNGAFNFTFEKPVTSEFKFVIEKTDYFPKEQSINPDKFGSTSVNILNFETSPSAEIFIHLKNNSPVNSSDLLQFQILGSNESCAECCTSHLNSFYGTSVDTTYSCLRYAKRYMTYYYTVTKNGNVSVIIDSVYCNQGSANTLEILY